MASRLLLIFFMDYHVHSVEGLTGERAIYRKRGEDDPEIGLFQDKPKRMNFVFDLSARYIPDEESRYYEKYL